MSELKSELENNKKENEERDDKLWEVMKQNEMLNQTLSTLKAHGIKVRGLSMLEDLVVSQVSKVSFSTRSID